MLPLLLLAATVSAQPDYSEMIELIENYAVEYEYTDFTVAFGNAEGNMFKHIVGEDVSTRPMRLASAGKWVSGMLMMQLVESPEFPEFNLDAHPQRFLDWWTTSEDEDDLHREEVTLKMLLGFTSGIGGMMTDVGDHRCLFVDVVTTEQCAQLIHNAEEQWACRPGTCNGYGSAHLCIAAAMAEAAVEEYRGEPHTISQLFIEFMTGPDAFNLPSVQPNPGQANNPPLGHGLYSSPDDYEKIMQLYMDYTLLTEESTLAMETYQEPTPFLPGQRYCLTNWIECTLLRWNDICENYRVHSSSGSLGFHPLVDRVNNYYIVVGVEIPESTFWEMVLGLRVIFHELMNFEPPYQTDVPTIPTTLAPFNVSEQIIA